MKTCIIDVGGGYRGVYAAGIFEQCMRQGQKFDVGIGVSAGSANLITYAAGQQNRGLKFYTEYGLRRQYGSLWNKLTKGSYIDLDYVYSTLSNSDGESPLDFETAKRCGMEYVAVATDAYTGEPHYFTMADFKQDDYSPIKASCALPFVCQPYPIGDRLFFDGAISDMIPVKKAFELGCHKVVLILTLPVDTIRNSKRDDVFARRIRKRYPVAAQCLRQRAERYNQMVVYARELEAQGKVLILAPDDTCGVTTLCRDPEAMTRLYEKGLADAGKIRDFLEA